MRTDRITLLGTVSALGLTATLLFIALLMKQEEITPKDPVVSREVVTYEEVLGAQGEEPTIKYSFKGERLPERLTPNEDVSKRTETSYASLLAVENKGTKEEKRTYRGVFFTEPTFTKEEDGWYYLEHATTTETAFFEARKQNPLAAVFWQRAYALTASPFSGAGDGAVNNSLADSIANCIASASGTSASPGGTVAYALAARTGVSTTCDVDRVFLPFTTSSIPASGTISAATLTLYPVDKGNADNDGDDVIDILQTNQSSSTTLTTSDFPGFVGTTLGATAIDITGVTVGTAITFTLNATGIGWIKKSGQTSICGVTAGVTCLGAQEGHVKNNGLGLANTATGNFLGFSTSEQTGTAQDPFMTITYTAPAGFAFWQFQDF